MVHSCLQKAEHAQEPRVRLCSLSLTLETSR